MTDRPMTPLGRVLAEKGRTMVEAAERLGVSRQSVWAWVQGERPLPAVRQGPLEAWLGVPPGTLSSMVSDDPRAGVRLTRPESPRTFLDWLLRMDILSAHLGERWGDRVESVADVTGEPVGEVLDWVWGKKRVPMGVLVELHERYWPGLPFGVWVFDAGVRVTQAEAVAEAVSALDPFGGFDDAVAVLVAARAEWLKDPTVPVDVVVHGLRSPGETVFVQALRQIAERTGRELPW